MQWWWQSLFQTSALYEADLNSSILIITFVKQFWDQWKWLLARTQRERLEPVKSVMTNKHCAEFGPNSTDIFCLPWPEYKTSSRWKSHLDFLCAGWLYHRVSYKEQRLSGRVRLSPQRDPCQRHGHMQPTRARVGERQDSHTGQPGATYRESQHGWGAQWSGDAATCCCQGYKRTHIMYEDNLVAILVLWNRFCVA